MIKNIYLLITFIFLATMTQSQQWLENLPQQKAQQGELSFFEIQAAFNQWCADNNVVDGYFEKDGEKTKVPYWKQFNRWEWYWTDRVDPVTGKFPETTAIDEYEKYMKQLGGNKSAFGNWVNLGTSSSSGGYAGIGRLNCIAFRPGSSNIFYVGSPSGGLWKTADGGSTWTVLTDNNAVLGVSDIVVVPTPFQDILYIATGDKDGGSGWSMGGGQSNDNNSIGVLKSTDGGATWNATGLSWTTSQIRRISRLILDPNSSNNTIYAATSVGIYKTTNAGTTWTLQQSGSFIDMEMNPGSSNTLYASTKDYWGNPLIYYTTNGGTSWSVSKTFATTDYRVDLAVTAANSTYVYAIVANQGGGLTSIEKSTNSGTSFSSVYTAGASGTWLLGYYCDGTYPGGGNSGQGGYDLCIAADPTVANTVFIGGVNTWKSTNGGTSWSINSMWTGGSPYNTCGAPVVHADKHFLAFQNGTSTLFECNDGGIYKTTNGGTTWSDLTNGITISQIYRIGNAQTSATEVINGLQDNGTKTYSAGTWTDAQGGDGMECFIDYSNINTQYGEYPRGDIRRTTTHWASTTNITAGLSGTGDWVTPFIIDPNVSSTIYVGYQDVFKSLNQGTSWTKISTWAGSKLKSLAVAPSNSNYIYAATATAIYRTTNGGSSWTTITGTLPTGSANITYVSVHATNSNILWVAMGGYNSYGVYESTNGGSTWTNISTGLPNLPIMCVIQNNLNTTQTELYAGTDVGVYVKSGTAMWTTFMTGLPNVFVPELEIYYDNTTPGNSKLRAATFGRGLWESDLLTSTATWNGTVSNAWNTAANWTPAVVPSGATDVIIPASAPNWPSYTGNFSLGSQCKDLTMNGGSIFTINGNCTLPSGFTLTQNGASTLKVSGDWNNTGGTFVPGSGLVDFNGVTNTAINSSVTNSNSLTTTYSATNYWFSNYFDISSTGGKNITVNSFDIHCYTTSNVSVEIWYAPMSYVGNTGNPGVWSQLGTTQTVTGMGIGNPVNVNPGASITIPIGQTFGFFISCYSGSNGYLLYTNTATAYSNSDITISVAESSNSFQPGSGSNSGKSFNGTVYYSYNSSFPLSFWDIDNSKLNASITANDNLTINHNLNVLPLAWMTNSSGNSISVGNDFVIGADATGMASFIDFGTTTVTGNLSAKMFLTEMKWHYVSTPISNGVLGAFHLPSGNSDIWVKYWDEVNWQWVTINTIGTSLIPMKGYSVWVDNNVVQDETITFTGTLNNNITTAFPLTNTVANTDHGWNHIGNPYPSALDWDALSGWTKTNMDNTVYFWNPASGTGNYSYYVGSGSAPWSGGTSVNNGTRYIPSMQGFIVHCNNAGGGSIKMQNNARVHNAQSFYKESTSIADHLKLKVSGNNFSDEVVIRFFDGALESFDSDFDAYKLYGLAEAPQLYVLNQGVKMSVNSLPPFDDYRMVPIGLECDTDGQFTIEASDINSFGNSVVIYLEDLKEGIIQNLSETDTYSFLHEADDNAQRFIVHFGSPNGVESISEKQFSIFVKDHLIIIQNPELIAGKVKVFDLPGQLIYSTSTGSQANLKIALDSKPGYYLVKITSGENTQTAKVLLK